MFHVNCLATNKTQPNLKRNINKERHFLRPFLFASFRLGYFKYRLENTAFLEIHRRTIIFRNPFIIFKFQNKGKRVGFKWSPGKIQESAIF